MTVKKKKKLSKKLSLMYVLAWHWGSAERAPGHGSTGPPSELHPVLCGPLGEVLNHPARNSTQVQNVDHICQGRANLEPGKVTWFFFWHHSILFYFFTGQGEGLNCTLIRRHPLTFLIYGDLCSSITHAPQQTVFLAERLDGCVMQWASHV